MKWKFIIGGMVVLAGLILATVNFLHSNVEYGDFATAQRTGKKIQVKGEWVKDRESGFDTEKVRFTFYLKDDNNRIERVVLDGAKPNNFELAANVVAKGKYESGYFHATEVLTKCPSKYESASTPK
ncbi:MAG TPA: cytochrome c maturation protein CcmE [Bacteroidota bacterium]|nr:cytochrome c maturation protein CcmE [Bacteroidota bacterium]